MGGCPVLLVLVLEFVGYDCVVRVVPNAVVISHSRSAACRAIDVCLVSNVDVVVVVVLLLLILVLFVLLPVLLLLLLLLPFRFDAMVVMVVTGICIRTAISPSSRRPGMALMVVVVVLALVAAMVAVVALMGFRSAAVGCSNSSASLLLLLLLLFLVLLDSNASLVCVVEAIHFSHHVPFAEDGI